ncbi:SMI1/KNR4 family protein [Spartinivicinus ruber]|uniref:SMI1/KNR4 family protein n=1 Tax=Spartinivicinus ruber TaxID=2683272 RepID=UPI0013D4A59B|nr:SMI1/KNR4 family protein [Spartinivicinus ruber]
MKNLDIKNDNGILRAFEDGTDILIDNPSIADIHWTPMSRNFNTSQIKANEKALNIQLPSYYFDWLLACNGSKPKIPGKEGFVGVHCKTRLGGKSEFTFPWEKYFTPDDDNIVSEIIEAQYFLDGQPDEITREVKSIQLFPIWSCNGNLLCLDFSTNRIHPSISYADIEDEKLFPVTDSFRSLLLALTFKHENAY